MGQVLINFNDKFEDEKKFALYRWDHSEAMPKDV